MSHQGRLSDSVWVEKTGLEADVLGSEWDPQGCDPDRAGVAVRGCHEEGRCGDLAESSWGRWRAGVAPTVPTAGCKDACSLPLGGAERCVRGQRVPPGDQRCCSTPPS